MTLVLVKAGDGLFNPKLILSWLLTALGTPAVLIGLLVPIREAGSLLPQLWVSAHLTHLPQRKWVWMLAALVQALCVFSLVLVVWLVPQYAGPGVLFFVLLLAISRSVISVSYKDILGKTVAKARRGRVSGNSSSIAAIAVLGFGVALVLGWMPKTVAAISGLLVIAGVLWLLATLTILPLQEPASPALHRSHPARQILGQLSLLRTHTQLRRFIVVRALLLPTALAPPFWVVISYQQGSASASDGSMFTAELGAFVVAGAIASLSSGYLWGRWSDRSSRQVLCATAALAATVLTVMAVVTHWQIDKGWLSALLLLVLLLAHEGIRIGRATHVVDMSTAEYRAAYTAVANTAIGLVLIAGGAWGVLVEWLGMSAVFGLMGASCGLALWVASRLREVQRTGHTHSLTFK